MHMVTMADRMGRKLDSAEKKLRVLIPARPPVWEIWLDSRNWSSVHRQLTPRVTAA